MEGVRGMTEERGTEVVRGKRGARDTGVVRGKTMDMKTEARGISVATRR